MRTLALVFVVACGPQANWSTAFSSSDRIVLSAWGTEKNQDRFFSGGGIGSGVSALALHFDGKKFVDLQAPGTDTLWWTFGFSPTDVWFAGEHGTVLHWDGSVFSASQSGTTETLYGIWGSAADDLWAVGGSPNVSAVIVHYNGQAWSAPSSTPASSGAWWKVWGCARDRVFVVGDGGAIAFFDGNNWTVQTSNTTLPLFTVAGRGCSDVYAVGGRSAGIALHYDGSSWSSIAALKDAAGFSGVSVDSVGDVIVSGGQGRKFRRHLDIWSDDSLLVPHNADFHAAFVAAPDDIFVVGGNFSAPAGSPRTGEIAHYGK